MLVVIAIISILASMLLQGLQNAYHMATATVCNNNLRQVGMVFAEYTNNNRDYVHPWGVSVAGGGWYAGLHTIMDGVDDAMRFQDRNSILVCDGAAAVRERNGLSRAMGYLSFLGADNKRYAAYTTYPQILLFWNKTQGTGSDKYRVTHWKRPHKVSVYLDGGTMYKTNHAEKTQILSHGKSSNFLFLDGHSKSATAINPDGGENNVGAFWRFVDADKYEFPWGYPRNFDKGY